MNVFDMLEKAGYEAQNIGSGLLPATLMHDGTPVGFLMPDLSLSLVTEHTQEREALAPLVQYCVDTQGLDAMTNGEAKLTQYENAVLTSSYDFIDRRPIYSLYTIDAEKNLTNVGIFYEKEQATRQFASFSGLVGETPAQGRTEKIKQFAQAIEKRGYKLLDGEKKENRAFDIRDKDGNLVGYIGKDNRVTMVTDNPRQRQFLAQTYTRQNAAALPGFFEKLRDKLHEIGMALKVRFSGKGREYSIQDDKRVTVATVDEKSYAVQYTQNASEAQKHRIDALIEEVQRDYLQRQQESKAQEVTETKPQEQAAPPAQEAVSPEREPIPEHQPQDSKEPIQETPASKAEQPTHVAPPAEVRDYSPKEQQALSDFMKALELMQTLDGFNPEQYASLQNDTIEQFGTAELSTFMQKLEKGEFGAKADLGERLKEAGKESQRQNQNRDAQPKPEKTQEQEKE